MTEEELEKKRENTVWDTDVYLDDIDKANDIKVPPFTDEQKKVIEATEKLANGKLICDVDDDIDVLTNDEWRRICSTEEFAKWIANNIKVTINLTHGNREYTELITSAEWWYRWLKQPHKE